MISIPILGVRALIDTVLVMRPPLVQWIRHEVTFCKYGTWKPNPGWKKEKFPEKGVSVTHRLGRFPEIFNHGLLSHDKEFGLIV